LPRTILFDLDGTLVDSLPDLATSLNRVLADEGLAPLTMPELAPLVGDGLGPLVARALAARGRGPDRALLTRFRRDYFNALVVATRPFPGVPETLAALAQAGWRMAVCTNKPEQAARRILAALGLAARFAAITGGDTFAVRKPDPGHPLGTLAAAGGDPARAIMIGDHANDIMAARGAGIVPVFALWGYGRAEMADGALALKAISGLPALAEDLLPAAPAPGQRAPQEARADPP